ncbi:MAG: DNA translocase FtsK 4TM domain-containing protein, partial [Aestuariivirga sp.]
MAVHDTFDTDEATIPAALRRFLKNRLFELCGIALLIAIFAIAFSLASWSINDPSLNHATGLRPTNWLGSYGAIISDQLIQLLGLGALVFIF